MLERNTHQDSRPRGRAGRPNYRTLWKPGCVENCEMVVQISRSISFGRKL